MALLTIQRDPHAGHLLVVTVCLSNSDVAGVCGAPKPALALASLLVSLDGAAVAARVAAAVASRTAWRLHSKNRRYGNQGLKIVFALDSAATAPDRLRACAVASCRIRDPGWTASTASRRPSILIGSLPA